jgi:hypothetical protein
VNCETLGWVTSLALFLIFQTLGWDALIDSKI